MDISLGKNIFWVGYVDWTVRDFHGYATRRGSSYNSYLIKDEKSTVIDAVKAPYSHVLIERVAAQESLDKIAYIVCNHAEPDHSGGLPDLVKACPNAEVVCNRKCSEALGEHYDTHDWKFKLVDDGDSMSIGEHTLQFINTPMVHWPESMFTYVIEDKLLFSMDAFGQHYASAHRFDDEEPLEKVMQEAKTYFANIVMLYDGPIKRTLAKAGSIDIETIAPSHGVIWRKNIGRIIDKYMEWLHQRPAAKVVLAYDTMWQSTEVMAKAILEGVLESDVDAKLINLREGDFTALATEVLDCAALAVGSPTLNKGLMPQVAAGLTYLKGLAPKKKSGFAFGSYGWTSGGAQEVERYLQEMKVDVVRDPLTCRYKPNEKVLEECRGAGRMLAEVALKKYEESSKERE